MSRPARGKWGERVSLWIESHQDLARHPKTKRLARALGVSKATAIGHLHLLWWWALSYAYDGQRVPPYDEADIADAVAWDGDPADLVEALVAAGFFERQKDVILIHDWYDYAGKLLAKREEDRLRKARKRNKPDGPADVR